MQAQWGSVVYRLNFQASLFQMARKEEGKLLAGRRALYSCAPQYYNLIGRELPGAELKLVEQHEALQSTAIFRTNSKVARNMASFFGKHLIYPSTGVPKSMADLRRYEGFFPNMSGATYDPISLMNEEKNLSREPSSSFSSDSTTPSRDDDIFSNATFAFSSSGDDSTGSSQASNDVYNEGEKAVLLKTPKKNLGKRVSPRKPLKPVKSVNPCDPSFKGVTLHMKTTLKKGKSGLKTRSEAQLVIDCCFTSKKKRRCSNPEFDCKTSRRRLSSPGLNPSVFKLQNSPESLYNDGSPLDVDLGTAPIQVEKECASCGTFKTPLWRDAEDGTHLCNACGIRYKKYRIRCVRCWYIPKKEEKALPCCTSCGHTYKITLSRKGNPFSCSE